MIIADGYDLDYLHARIDALIRQTAVEVGLLNSDGLSREGTDSSIQLARNRYAAADDAVAEQFHRPRRKL